AGSDEGCDIFITGKRLKNNAPEPTPGGMRMRFALGSFGGDGGGGGGGATPATPGEQRTCRMVSPEEIRKHLPKKGAVKQLKDGIASYIDGFAWGVTAVAARAGLIGERARNQAADTNARLSVVYDQIRSHPGQTARTIYAAASKYPVQTFSRMGSGAAVSVLNPYLGAAVTVTAVYGSAFKAAHQNPNAVAVAAVVGESC
ncbi:MAG TPA: hypothetical protein VEZ70_04515, partial [Allosphingosinicella sp.]|nr:hypothetical protein [Allosphingosinicella sp.]